jgi:glycerol-3-phosphate acyltransferase PlsY
MEKNVEGNVEQRKSVKSLMAVIGVAALAALGAWQFYLFVSFKNAQGVADVQGGTVHLWLAIGIALIVCIAGVFLFSRFLRYDTRDEIHITSAGPPLGAGRNTKDLL